MRVPLYVINICHFPLVAQCLNLSLIFFINEIHNPAWTLCSYLIWFISTTSSCFLGFYLVIRASWWLSCKEHACNVETDSIPDRKVPWRREWLSMPILACGKPPTGQRAGVKSQGCRVRQDWATDIFTANLITVLLWEIILCLFISINSVVVVFSFWKLLV